MKKIVCSVKASKNAKEGLFLRTPARMSADMIMISCFNYYPTRCTQTTVQPGPGAFVQHARISRH